MTLTAIAIRNIGRNRRRSVLSSIDIATFDRGIHHLLV